MRSPGRPTPTTTRPSIRSRSPSDGGRPLGGGGRGGAGADRTGALRLSLGIAPPRAGEPAGAATRRRLGGPGRPPGLAAARPGGLEQGLKDLEALVERQGEVTEASLRTSLRFQGMVRYDAYRDMGGQQSWSIALLDANRSGAVVTSLHARDHARVYLKEMAGGTPSQRLSPEEERAVALALGRPAPPPRDPEAPPAAPGDGRAAGETEGPPPSGAA